jgi:cytochrome c556
MKIMSMNIKTNKSMSMDMISIEQINNLFQKLSNIQKENQKHDIDSSESGLDPTNNNAIETNTNRNSNSNSNNSLQLPDEIIKAMQAMKESETQFLTAVDRFVHNVDDIRKANIINDIIDTCPQFLFSRNKHGLLPIHTACFRDSCSTYVPLFANAGVKYGLGNASTITRGRIGGRGGLLEETAKGNNTFELLAGSTDAIYKDDKCLVDTMKVLMMDYKTQEKKNNNSSSSSSSSMTSSEYSYHTYRHLYPQKPLLWKEELRQAGFLLKALTNERIAMSTFLIGFDPIKLYTDLLGDDDHYSYNGNYHRNNTTRSKSNNHQTLTTQKQIRPFGYGDKKDSIVGTWPIHIACCLNHEEGNTNTIQTSKSIPNGNGNYKLFRLLLERGMKHRHMVLDCGYDDYLGGLFAIDARTNESTFELAMRAFGEAKTWKCIRQFIPSSSSSDSNNSNSASTSLSNDFHILQRAIMTLPSL